MTRTATLVAITLISALATPVVVHATTSKAPVKAVATPALVASVEPRAAEPTCVRRIKVVYAGYGEGQATPCAVLTR